MGWVKCAERMPEHHATVWGYWPELPQERQVRKTQHGNQGWYLDGHLCQDTKPTRWYDDDPPPEPPKEETDQVVIDRELLCEIVQTLNCALAPEAMPAFVLRRVRQAHRWLRNVLNSEDCASGPQAPEPLVEEPAKPDDDACPVCGDLGWKLYGHNIWGSRAVSCLRCGVVRVVTSCGLDQDYDDHGFREDD